MVARIEPAPARLLPEGTDSAPHGAEDLAAVVHAPSSRKRKTLGGRLPADALGEILQAERKDPVATTARARPSVHPMQAIKHLFCSEISPGVNGPQGQRGREPPGRQSRNARLRAAAAATVRRISGARPEI